MIGMIQAILMEGLPRALMIQATTATLKRQKPSDRGA